jgi:heme-binding protein
MKRLWKLMFLAFLFMMFAIQLVRPSISNPAVDPAREITAAHPMTPEVAAILQRSCNDCHSNRTVWRWYSIVAPASWLVSHDVREGRDALNLSEWTRYAPQSSTN